MRHPFMKMIGRAIHHRRKFTAIIGGRVPTLLHAFNHLNILGKYGATHVTVGGPHSVKCAACDLW